MFENTKRCWERQLEWSFHWRRHRPAISFKVRNGSAFKSRLKERNQRCKRDEAMLKLQRYYETIFGESFHPKHFF